MAPGPVRRHANRGAGSSMPSGVTAASVSSDAVAMRVRPSGAPACPRNLESAAVNPTLHAVSSAAVGSRHRDLPVVGILPHFSG